jgi:hypothetical protein
MRKRVKDWENLIFLYFHQAYSINLIKMLRSQKIALTLLCGTSVYIIGKVIKKKRHVIAELLKRKKKHGPDIYDDLLVALEKN